MMPVMENSSDPIHGHSNCGTFTSDLRYSLMEGQTVMIDFPARQNSGNRASFFQCLLKAFMFCALALVFFIAACSSKSSGAQSADEVIEKSVEAIATDDYSSFLNLVAPEARYEFVNDMFQLAVGPRLMMLRFNPNKLSKQELRNFLETSKLPEDLLATANLQSLALPENADLELVLNRIVYLTQHQLLTATGSGTHIKIRETGLFYFAAASQIDIVEVDDNHSEAAVSFVPPGETQQKTVTVSIMLQDGRYYLQPPFPTWPWGRVESDE